MHQLTVALLLLCICTPAAEAFPQSLKDELNELTREYGASTKAWAEKYDNAKTEDESIARHRHWPGWTFAPKFVAFAERARSSQEGFESLREILRMGNSVGEFDRELFAYYERAIELVLANHRAKDLRPLCAEVRLTKQSEQFLRTQMTDGNSRETRADAYFYLGRLLAKKREMCFPHSWVKRLPVGKFGEYSYARTKENIDQSLANESIAQLYSEAICCFEHVVADFSDVLTMRGGATLGDRARREIYELKHLTFGVAAPDIAANDLAGDSMRLSDHRGKVVLLVFWASWCGPCMGDVPHEKELHASFAGRPFVIVGVNADKTLEAAKNAVNENTIPWRSFWNGDKDTKGSIVDDWNVQGWPTVYVLDHMGKIRFKQLRREQLDEPLEQLVKEAEINAAMTE